MLLYFRCCKDIVEAEMQRRIALQEENADTQNKQLQLMKVRRLDTCSWHPSFCLNDCVITTVFRARVTSGSSQRNTCCRSCLRRRRTTSSRVPPPDRSRREPSRPTSSAYSQLSAHLSRHRKRRNRVRRRRSRQCRTRRYKQIHSLRSSLQK